ncbi:MAG: helix-turn-helix domain-containing protein [Acidobacteria bacterium]|nr:helix-turn-helix domain-containing protein [Acidobacteriota bacterium]
MLNDRMDVTQVFAENIRRLRLAKGVSQEALADLAGLHRTYVGAVERGERNITLINANRIAEALGVKLSDCLKERNGRKKAN